MAGQAASARRKTALTKLWEQDGEDGSPMTTGAATAGCPRRPHPQPCTHGDCKFDPTVGPNPTGRPAAGLPPMSVHVCPSCPHATGCPYGTAPCPYACHGVESHKGRGLQHPPHTQHPTSAAFAHLHVENRFPMGMWAQHEPPRGCRTPRPPGCPAGTAPHMNTPILGLGLT